MAYREWLKIYRILFFFTFDDDNKKNEFWWVQWRIPKDQTYPEVVRIYLFANRCKEVHTVTPDTLTLICFQMDVFDIKMHLLPLYMRKAEGPSRKCIKFNVASAKNDCWSLFGIMDSGQWVCMMAASLQNRWFRILVDLLWLGLFRSNLFSPSPPSRKSANYQQHTLSYLVLSCYSTSIAQYLSLRSSPFSHPSTSSSHVHFPEFSDLWRYEWPGRS